MRAMAVSVSVPKPAAARVALRLSMSCFVRSEHAAGQSAAGRKSGAAGSSRRTACLKRCLKWSRASPVTTHTLQACVLRHDGDHARAASRISVMSSSLTGSSAVGAHAAPSAQHGLELHVCSLAPAAVAPPAVPASYRRLRDASSIASLGKAAGYAVCPTRPRTIPHSDDARPAAAPDGAAPTQTGRLKARP